MLNYDKYYFLDNSKDMESDDYEVILLATSIHEAWDVLDYEYDRYTYVAGPEDDGEYEWLVD